MKDWVKRCLGMLDSILGVLPQEINELDWKEQLSPKNESLCRHLCAFANHPGGGFIVFGIQDGTGRLVGVSELDVQLITDKLANLGRNGVEPMAAVDHAVVDYQSVRLLLVFIPESMVKPVQIRGQSIEESYIRAGGTTRRASRHELGSLMLNSKVLRWEELRASNALTPAAITAKLDFESIARLLGRPSPTSTDAILQWLVDERMILPCQAGGHYVTNLGAVAAARDLGQFDDISRKAVRIIKYSGRNKTATDKEHVVPHGYAVGFEQIISTVELLLPEYEVIRRGLRVSEKTYPTDALREIIANALIHQDFSIRGTGPRIEIYADRIEITNPGKLLPSKRLERLIGTQPESRNETLAAKFRLYHICEERGSGLEKAVRLIELVGLPPVQFQEAENAFIVTLYSPRAFREMSVQERIEAAYQHATVCYLDNRALTNTSLRDRLRLSERQRSQVSRVINEAVAAGRLKPKSPESTAKKFAEYLPWWAA
jgi:ATP-dependent DNA helicase RecG